MAGRLSFLLLLIGFKGSHSITTVSKVSAKAGESISIPCLYKNGYRDNVKYLCKGSNWITCSYEILTNDPSSKEYSISDDKNQRIFTVTLKSLTVQETYYWCAVMIKGNDHKASFHLSVTTGLPSLYVEQQEITGMIGENISINCYNLIGGKVKWCKLGNICVSESSGTIDGTSVTIHTKADSVSIVTMKGLRTESSGWYLCVAGDLQMPVHVTVTERHIMTTTNLPTSSVTNHSVEQDLKVIIIPLCLLILAVMATLFTWFILRRYKQTKEESSATTMAEEDVIYTDVMTNGKINKKFSRQRTLAVMKRDVDVMYTTVVDVKRPTVQRVKAKAEDVTYSTLALQQ